MELFISWSGVRSNSLAKVFKTYLPKILPNLVFNNIFMSSSDIDKGEVWFYQIQKKLKNADAVLVLLTEENIDSPWILFEAGAVSNIGNNLVFTYLIDNIHIDASSPLSHFQAITSPSEKNTKELILSLYDGDRINEVIASFNDYWPNIEKVLNSISVRESRSVEDIIKIESRKIKNEAIDLVNTNRDNPFSYGFIGWYSALISEVINPAHKNSFTASPKFYHHCLSGITKYGIVNIQAIADLSNPVDDWRDSHINLWNGVSERIFYINWEYMFDETKLIELINILKASSNRYKENKCEIFLVTSKEVNKIRTPILSNDIQTLGYNLFLARPNIVGAYIEDKAGEALYLEATTNNEKLMNNVSDFYEIVKRKALKVYDGKEVLFDINQKSLRKEWIRKNKLGSWKEEWAINSSLNNYCDNYDVNIRLWTPNYDKLITQCSEIILEEIIKLFRESQRSLKLLELGFGTGALTEKIFIGISNINEPGSVYKKQRYNHCIPISSYYGIDSSKCMRLIVEDSLLKTQAMKKYNFQIDIRDDEFHLGWTPPEKVDILFGSLILHYIFSENTQQQVIKLFTHIDQYILKEGKSSMVFLCTIFSEETEQKKQQINYWREYMAYMGQSNSDIDNYILKNNNMVDSPSYSQLLEAATHCGFNIDRKVVFKNSPFVIISLMRQ